ncbi:MAG TPA: hemerythrin domain-containing protein [Verrucomicrobiae bacterium]|jgi:hemerythrin-like domain-containing protein|nr:hemerythrin domain-containing protein [Verrucomicrobiae bacterium]
MTLALSIIREEHRSLSAVIRSLDLLAREARDRGHEPDYELFTVMLDYVEGFSDRFHHPKEDEHLFSALRRRAPEANHALDVLEGDHARGEELIRDLRYLLSRCRVGGAAAVDVFAAAVGEYVDFYWRHMRLEEDVVMPLAERKLTPADWQPIDAAFQANDDPLFGARPREEFKRLFGLILNRAPAPVGVGPERKTP